MTNLAEASELNPQRGGSCMGSRSLATVAAALTICLAIKVFGQDVATSNQATIDTNDSRSGIRVERVEARSTAEAAGIKPGDILLSWNQQDTRSKFDSPFDLLDLEINQATQGPVTLEGLRGTQKQTWVVSPGEWGIVAGAQLSDALQLSYERAESFSEKAQYQESKNQWQSLTLEAARAPNPAWLSSWIRFHAAETFAKARRWKEVDEWLDAALKSSTGVLAIHILHLWAASLQERTDKASANEYYHRALTESRLPSKGLIIASYFNDLGMVALSRRELNKAEEYFRRAITAQEKQPSENLVFATSLYGLGSVAWYKRDLKSAEEYGRRALTIREQVAPNSLDVAQSLNYLGSMAFQGGDLDAAEKYWVQASDIRSRLAPDSRATAWTYSNLGSLLWQKGDLERAETYQHRALDLQTKADPNSSGVADALCGLAIVAWEKGELKTAENLYRHALRIYERIAPKSGDVAETLSNIASLLADRGELIDSERYLRRSLGIEQGLSHHSVNVAVDFIGLGEHFYQLGNLSRAEKYGRAALEMLRRVAPQSVYVADALINLGEIEEKRGAVAAADTDFRDALIIRQRLSPGTSELALTLKHLGDVAGDRAELSEAEKDYRESLEILEKVEPGSTDCAEVLAGLAEVARQDQKVDVAVQLYEDSINSLEAEAGKLGGSDQARAEFRSIHQEYYHKLIELLIQQKQPEIAFQVLERSRARTLVEMLTAAQIDIRKGADPKLLDQQRSLRTALAGKTASRVRLVTSNHTEEQLAALDATIKKLLGDLNEIDNQLHEASPAYSALTQPQALSIADVQGLLDSDTALLEYSLGKQGSYLFQVTADSINVYKLAARSEIEGIARALYRNLSRRNDLIKAETAEERQARWARAETQYLQLSRRLSRVILGPIAANLRQRRLVVVTDGALQYVPFGILPLESSEPLMVKQEVVSLPSASLLPLLRQQEHRNLIRNEKTVAVLADPVFNQHDPRVTAVRQEHSRDPKSSSPQHGEYPEDLTRSVRDVGLISLPRLRFTRDEAREIVSLARPGTGLLALDFNANRSVAIGAELGQYRVVHFATHALVDNAHPELSGLVLSLVNQRGGPQNGFVTLEDIYNLNLSADLVVLSACQTALGKDVSGEGLVGLTRGFMYAGSSRVMASLWNVSDRATSELMKSFYKGLLRDGMTPAEALQVAQIRMWKDPRWHSPYYWAAFQIQGDWQ